MLLSEFFDTIYFPRRLRGKSPNSVRLYRFTIKRFGMSLGRPATVDDLNENAVLLHLSRRSGVSAATRNKELNQLTAMWRLACRQGLLTIWPDIRKEHEPERAPVAWLPEELTRLVQAASTMPGLVGQIPANDWWGSFVRVTLDSGERVSAVSSIEWAWLNGEWLHVPAEARKGKTRDRRYRLSRETLNALASLRKSSWGSPEMFPWPYSPTYLWTKYRQVVERAGLPTGRIYQLHCLRKTVASAVHASGMNPQEALDHSDRRTTQRYIDQRMTRDRQPCDILAEYLANPRKPPESQQRHA